jgi:uncharacterized oligopeptide transporter (OPT) family protein
MTSIDFSVWNFAIRVGIFVLFSFAVVLVVGLVARLFFFENAHKSSRGTEGEAGSLPPPPATSGSKTPA